MKPNNVAQYAMHIADGLITNPNASFSDILNITRKGHLEMFAWASQLAALANTLYEEGAPTKSTPGVFQYSVSCKFGIWLSKYILDNKIMPTVEVAEKELRDLSAKFFAKS